MLTKDWEDKYKIKFLTRHGYTVTKKKHTWGDEHYGFDSAWVYEVWRKGKPFVVFTGHYDGEDSCLNWASHRVLTQLLQNL